jgi:2-iminobutanoate/2-iminopropanoate deaminase
MKQKVCVSLASGKSSPPYSHAVVFGDLVFVSGQGPVDIESGAVVQGDFEQKMKAALDNTEKILLRSGSSLSKVLKATVYLADLSRFASMNDYFRKRLGPDLPARTTVEAARLPLDLEFEIDVIAHL